MQYRRIELNTALREESDRAMIDAAVVTVEKEVYSKDKCTRGNTTAQTSVYRIVSKNTATRLLYKILDAAESKYL